MLSGKTRRRNTLRHRVMHDATPSAPALRLRATFRATRTQWDSVVLTAEELRSDGGVVLLTRPQPRPLSMADQLGLH
jgi:hypothetical protein